jgi:hypothetical protein
MAQRNFNADEKMVAEFFATTYGKWLYAARQYHMDNFTDEGYTVEIDQCVDIVKPDDATEADYHIVCGLCRTDLLDYCS